MDTYIIYRNLQMAEGPKGPRPHRGSATDSLYLIPSHDRCHSFFFSLSLKKSHIFIFEKSYLSHEYKNHIFFFPFHTQNKTF